MGTARGYAKASLAFFVLMITPGALQLALNVAQGQTPPDAMHGIVLAFTICFAGAVALPTLLIAVAVVGGWLSVKFKERGNR